MNRLDPTEETPFGAPPTPYEDRKTIALMTPTLAGQINGDRSCVADIFNDPQPTDEELARIQREEIDARKPYGGLAVEGDYERPSGFWRGVLIVLALVAALGFWWAVGAIKTGSEETAPVYGAEGVGL